jgi:hypothetical protein
MNHPASFANPTRWGHRRPGLARCGLLVLWGLVCLPSGAEIYRCGNAYTNQPEPGADCARMGSPPVTVIEGTRVHGASAAAPAKASAKPASAPPTDASPSEKVDTAVQKERDQQARQILEAELAKALARQTELARLWNNGEPDRQGDEFKNPAKYQQRLADMRMGLLRLEADIVGLQRELARLGTVVAKP